VHQELDGLASVPHDGQALDVPLELLLGVVDVSVISAAVLLHLVMKRGGGGGIHTRMR
jgi:hypothetical protein